MNPLEQIQEECYECSSHNTTHTENSLKCLDCGGEFLEWQN